MMLVSRPERDEDYAKSCRYPLGRSDSCIRLAGRVGPEHAGLELSQECGRRIRWMNAAESVGT